MTWPIARAALQALLDGTTADAVAGFKTETLHGYEFPPRIIETEMLPCAFIHGPREEYDVTIPNLMEWSDIPSVRVEIALGPDDDREALTKRRDAWVQALKAQAALEASRYLGGFVLTRWTFEELRETSYEGVWGFDVFIAMNSYEG